MNSVALLSDGFHNLADAGSFGIAWCVPFVRPCARVPL
eukprot:CAMPEP_0114155972 /NCGR_PEP_ID=MMETSP0043_2-20121206/25781_1 /TAXON_ID=464988 /ORGANISM="Hemiselmis andersenii, Strain CCMP644" /LENGTH=37 /DNA_ID= /DNA_START= /DNA_END= /DNA_ORIENTATION=